MSKESPKSDENEFEEVSTVCTVCGKKMKFVKRKGASMEGVVCQACGRWETEGVGDY